MVLFTGNKLLQLDLNWNLNRNLRFFDFSDPSESPDSPPSSMNPTESFAKDPFLHEFRVEMLFDSGVDSFPMHVEWIRKPETADSTHFGPNSFAVRALCASDLNLLLRFISLYSSKAAKWCSSRDFAMTSLSKLRIYNKRHGNS